MPAQPPALAMPGNSFPISRLLQERKRPIRQIIEIRAIRGVLVSLLFPRKESRMSPVNVEKKGTTRRGFVKNVAAGAGGVALASSWRSVFKSRQNELIAAPVTRSGYEKYVLAPQIKAYQDLQVFEIKGKDARGYDFAVQLAPVDAIPLMNETGEVNADRVKAYIGGNPENVKDIGTEIEVSVGGEPEVYKIDSASVTYIPKGTLHRQRVLKKPVKSSFVLTLTLPPKYIEPAKPRK
jgi:hypothetical protein